MDMAILEVEHIQKTFEKVQVLKDISFSMEKGQTLSIIGSSGSGKTTLLRCLNFAGRSGPLLHEILLTLERRTNIMRYGYRGDEQIEIQ